VESGKRAGDEALERLKMPEAGKASSGAVTGVDPEQ
jgi:hypothetical protein